MILYAMIYAVAVALPIVLAAAVGAVFLRRHGRAERGVWLLALVLSLGLPLVTLARPPIAVATPWTPVLESVAIELTPVVVVPAAPAASPAVDLQGLLVVLWIIASVTLGMRWVASSIGLARAWRSWRVEVMDGLPVSLSPDTGPGVFGTLRPRIVVPSWVAALPEAQRALVLRHEQEHIRAGDHWLTAFVRLARMLAPWHPLVWLLTSRLTRAMELDCDRRVLRRHPDIGTYGATLLIVSARGSTELVGATAFAQSDVSLRKRILAMTTPPRTLSAVGLVFTTLVGGVLLTGALEVPVPDASLPVVHLSSALEVPPPVLDAPVEQVLESDPPAAPSAPETPQQSLVAPKVISDPTRDRVLLFRIPPRDSLGASMQNVVSETAIVAADGAWLLGPRQNASQRVEFDSFTHGLWGVILPFSNPTFPATQPRELTQLPRVLNADAVAEAVAQHYPSRLRDQGLGGTVGVHFEVDANGAVQRTRIGQVSAYPELDEAALRVAAVYQFSPALVGNEPIAVWVSHAVDFRAP